MSQASFGQWLAEQTGSHSMPQSQVSRYDCGVNAMSMAQVEACAPVAANWLAAQVHGMTTEQTAELILSALK